MLVGELPSEAAVFVTLRYQSTSGAPWILHDEAGYSSCVALSVTIISPNAGSDLCIGDAVSWEGAESGRYRLRIGTTPDGVEVLNKATAATSFTIQNLPDAPDLFVTLRHQAKAGDAWILYDEIELVECAESTIDISSPLEGSPLCAGDLIEWEGPDAGRFRLRIGTTPDGTDVFNQPVGDLGFTVGELPSDVDLHLSLRFRPEGTSTWILQDQVFVSACSD